MVDSRVAEEGRAIRRRRECEVCNQRFTTFERVENAPLLVAKRSGEKQPFDRAKLITGIRKACKNRPVLAEAMERVADDIVETLRLDFKELNDFERELGFLAKKVPPKQPAGVPEE